ncbi:DUF1508 domain-containing protein [Hymenobacter cavernae]|uniref:DUF1508 domain-containing protein n=1 Tax=Hymenobacter cavernae TaxID=2044852 RepID=A0ABQ1UM67_9BACT|nr:hypothetical protein GCM10011383_37610 [Hymenobacter cavernae]
MAQGRSYWEIYKAIDDSGTFQFSLIARNGTVVLNSHKNYSTVRGCQTAINNILKDLCGTQPLQIVDKTE